MMSRRYWCRSVVVIDVVVIGGNQYGRLVLLLSVLASDKGGNHRKYLGSQEKEREKQLDLEWTV